MEEKDGNGDTKQSEVLTCPICYDVIYTDAVLDVLIEEFGHKTTEIRGFTMDCGHYLHKECLFDYWDQAIYDFKFPLKCPIYECQKET